MYIKWWRDEEFACTRFEGHILDGTVEKLDLDHIDRAMLSQKIETPEDFLLNLEMLFRRYNEQKQK
jgi:hypothetical protein